MAADDVAGLWAGSPSASLSMAPSKSETGNVSHRRTGKASLAPLNDSREVIADPNALYSAQKLDERTLVPGKDARLGADYFEPGSLNPQQGDGRRYPLEESLLCLIPKLAWYWCA